MLYSKTTNGFYTRDIHGNNVPSDVVEITMAQYNALFDGQTIGKVIGSGEDGYPMLFERPQATEVELADGLRNRRNDLLAQSDWTQVLDSPLTLEQRSGWAVYRQQLRNLPNQLEFPFVVTWPEKP